MARNRIIYGSQSVWCNGEILYRVQTLGSTTTFTSEDIFELGHLDIVDVVDDVPAVAVTLNSNDWGDVTTMAILAQVSADKIAMIATASGSNANLTVVDSDGITLTQGSSAANKIEWTESGVARGVLYVNIVGSNPHTYLQAGPPGAANEASTIHLQAIPNAGSNTTIDLLSRTVAPLSAGMIDMYVDGTRRLRINSTGHFVDPSLFLVDAGILYFGHSGSYGLRRSGTHIQWFNGSSWVQLD